MAQELGEFDGITEVDLTMIIIETMAGNIEMYEELLERARHKALAFNAEFYLYSRTPRR